MGARIAIPKPVWAIAGGLVLVGTASLVVVAVPDGEQEAVQQPATATLAEGSATPDPLYEGLEKIIEDQKKPPFIGDRLGIYIVGTPDQEVDVPPQYVTAEEICPSGTSLASWDQAGELALDFDLPAEYNFQPHDPDSGVFGCDGVISSAKRAYERAGARTVLIGRTRITVRDTLHWPADRVKIVTIGGREAVLLEPVYPEGSEHGGTNTEILIPEPFGLTFVQTNDLTLAESLRLGEIVAELGTVLRLAGTDAQTGYLYSTWITAPTGSGPPTWENVQINCGWHAVCATPYPSGPYPDGPSLDSANNSSQANKVYFRGAFKRTNTSYEASHLRAVAHLEQTGDDRCDVFTVRIEEKYGTPANWHYRWHMRYVHANRSGVDDIFAIGTTGTGNGWWNLRWVGNMVNDRGGCDWTGTHVHDLAEINHAFPKALPGWMEDRPPLAGAIPTAPAALIPPAGWNAYDWSRHFEWAEAYP